MDKLTKNVGIVTVLAATIGVVTGMSMEQVEPAIKLLSETAQSQIAQAGFFFTVAAWLHSGRVKKEIRSNFSALTTAINEVANAFREDLKAQGERLDNLSTRVENLENKP